ncbi:hypothetical protein [Leptolyngbya sp. FACHB-36]|uniref:hypothetical protein n=1 Tax=Leptolyngbya sp. FACHB-36 TaxID=2692808 RepID=UPI001680048B|nr:hypothetical protein [Leptolyngbya sp. FACHB-36]
MNEQTTHLIQAAPVLEVGPAQRPIDIVKRPIDIVKRPIDIVVKNPNIPIATKPIYRLPTTDPVLTIPPDKARWINPKLADSISKIREPEGGIPRAQVTLPISPRIDVSDVLLFEDPQNAAKKFFLPRYRLLERNQQLQMSLEPDGQAWKLVIHLEKYPAPELPIEVRSAIELTHTVSVILQHRLVSGDANGGQKEWVFQAIVPEPGGVCATLTIASRDERDLLYQVLTEAAYGASLTVRRSVNVAIPLSASSPPPAPSDNPPAPQLQLKGTETYEAGGKQWTRYLLSVSNRSAFPNDLFAPAPDLPPCGQNRNSARTWVDIYAQGGAYLYGFCALSSANDLNGLWFAVAKDQSPPASVYITLNDRQLKRLYTSNPVSTAAPTTGNDGTIVSSGSGVIRGTWLFNFDTGTEVANDGDVWWQQQTDTVRYLVPRGNAQLVNLGVRDFNAISVSQLQKLPYSTVPIDGSISNEALLAIRAPHETPPIVPRPIGPNQLVNGNVFAVRTNSGNYAKVQVLKYGYNLQIQWVTYRPGSSEPLYRQVTRVSDMQPRSPFVFPANLYSYIFHGITGTGQTFKPILRQVGIHSYYQDPVQKYVFYYLPDSFKLVRRPESPHYPMIAVRFTPVGTTGEIRATIDYWAFPYVNAARLETAAKTLSQYLPQPLPVGVSGVVFQPLVASKPRLFLGLPNADGIPTNQERPDVLVELRTGFRDSRTLSEEAFQTVYDALFSESTQLFQGQVVVDLPDEQTGARTEVINFHAHINDMVGEWFDPIYEVDSTSGSVRVTLKNAIESPLRIEQLDVKLMRDGAPVPSTISGWSAALPVTLEPGQTLTFSVVASVPIALTSPPNLVFDLSRVRVLADPGRVFDSIIQGQTTAPAKRPITIKTTKAVFGDRIGTISVDLKHGGAVDFDRDGTQFTSEQIVQRPIRDRFVNTPDEGVTEYRITLILTNGDRREDPPNVWRTETSEMLWITTDKLPSLNP